MKVRLTSEEKALILRKRQQRVVQSKQEKFRIHALNIAYKSFKWSQKEGVGLTFSTFVNEFGYEESDVRIVYAAIMKIFETVRHIEVS